MTEKGNGMFSVIDKKIENTQMDFKHLGEIKDDKREIKSEWGNAHERYFLSARNGETELKVELDAIGEFEQFFSDTFPKALDLVKQLAEK